MSRHELKTWPLFFQLVANGSKRFEYRYDDRGFGEDDVLNLREWNPVTMDYTGREQEVHVTYVMRGGFGLPAGFVVMSIDPVKP